MQYQQHCQLTCSPYSWAMLSLEIGDSALANIWLDSVVTTNCKDSVPFYPTLSQIPEYMCDLHVSPITRSRLKTIEKDIFNTIGITVI